MKIASSSTGLAAASGSSKYDSPGMLHQILANEDYALALAPGFFRFYAHIGILQALEEKGCLRPSHVTGSSAGAMVGGFLASGMKPSEMIKLVLDIKRADIWDMGGFGGLLKGQLFQDMLVKHLPVQTIEACKYPLGVTTFDMLGLRTRCLTSGCLATAMRTSCTFPGLFQPVMIEGSPNIDGGVFDGVGLMALPSVLGLDTTVDVPPDSGNHLAEQNTLTEVISPAKHDVVVEDAMNKAPASSKKRAKTPIKSAKIATKSSRKLAKANADADTDASRDAKAQQQAPAVHVHKTFSGLVVNVVFGRSSISSSVLPPQLKNHKLLTVVVENIPMVYPFTMDTMGVVAFKVARVATLRALHSTHMQELAPHHWCCYIDGAVVNPADFPLPSVPVTSGPPLSRENLRVALMRRSSTSSNGGNNDDSSSSSADSAHIEHTWTTQAQRRSTGSRSRMKRKQVQQEEEEDTCVKKMRTRSSTSSLHDSHFSETSSSSGAESEESDYSSADENEDVNSRLMPSFSFLNGTFRLYDAAVTSMSDTMHRIEDASLAVSSTLHSIEDAIEDAGSAIMHDASSALLSAKKRLNTSSKKLYQAVRTTIETVVHDLDLVSPEDTTVDAQEQEKVEEEDVDANSSTISDSKTSAKASSSKPASGASTRQTKSAPSSVRKSSRIRATA